MAREIEKKFRLSEEQVAEIESRLVRLGAVPDGSQTEENLIYSSESLQAQSSVIRIRRTESRSTLTYKRRMSSDNEMKEHIEYESEIGSPDEAGKILLEMGLRLTIVYEKRRRIWTFSGSEIVLDELPFGCFLEIEGEPDSIREAEIALDALELTYEPLTYPLLTIEFGEKKGDVIEARFR
ncbi:MAG: CYTH domain-containing protein [Acidobacteria bacterium]|nr:MAG: CYTH domain-containing protein [Acidobacteriota bacterium]REK02106.1 MAG: CYTH domain-containing protein [Acidobacteriota bacterium]REK14092.1 MAG: CYTH domain-containing protein [Acidobacteriota bacterium]REK42087.1 MAG: CYTH domain-containing protein [Acidobacteriota bacterium]